MTYDVVISVQNQDLALLPGLSADVRIVTDRREDVLRVPNTALHFTPNRVHTLASAERVWALRNNQPTAISVALGLEDDAYTEIVRGDVKEGDQVITAEQNTENNTTTALRLRF